MCLKKAECDIFSWLFGDYQVKGLKLGAKIAIELRLV